MSAKRNRKQLARAILQRMGETGQPPERGALLVNAGTEGYLDILRGEYLVPIKETGMASSFKLVQATFGGGKTHFLHCLREVAWEEGFVTAKAELSRNEVPCDDPVRVYQAVAQRVELPPASVLDDSDPGIEVVLKTSLERRFAAHGEEEARRWIQRDFGSARVDSRAVRRAAQLYMEAILEDDFDRVLLMGAFLRGENVGADEVRSLEVRETLEKATAFRFLRSLLQVLRALGVPGVVLLFDEMDRVMALPRGRRRTIADTVREVIDACGQSSLPGVLWVYAVPPEFRTNLVPEYPALAQRLEGSAAFASVSPQAPLIDLERLPLGPVALLEAIGQKLLGVYEEAHAPGFDRKLQARNLRLLARQVGEGILEVGARRAFVRAAVALLADQHRAGQRPLDEVEVRRHAQSAEATAPAPMPGEEVF